MSGYTQTPNLSLYKPTVGADDDAWGGHLNANADTLDTQIATKTYTDGRRRRFLNAVTTSVPNVGASTAEEAPVVWTVPAGTLVNVGDMLHCFVKFDCAGTTDSKNCRTRWTSLSNGLSGATLGSAGTSASGTTALSIECWVMKTASNAQRFWSWSIQATNSMAQTDGTAALTDTAVNYFSITLTNNTSIAPGSITIFSAFLEFLPAV